MNCHLDHHLKSLKNKAHTQPKTDSLIKRFIFFCSSPNLQRQVTEYCIKKNHGNVHFTQTPEGRDNGGAGGVKWMGEAGGGGEGGGGSESSESSYAERK